MTILGIDPGITGGVAFLYPNINEVAAYDIPNVDGEVDVDTLFKLIGQQDPSVGVIERVGAMPKQGVSSTFRFGQAAGALAATIVCARVPLFRVAPAKWKRHFGLSADKEEARAKAIQLWPGADCFTRKKDHGRAEAALIALYHWQTAPRM